jgi:hypothetical protein
MSRYLWVLAAAALALGACGDTRAERTASGAAIGAGAGAVLGAVTGLGPVTGTLAGATVGGLTGMITDKNQVDLGGSSDSEQAAPANQTNEKKAAPAEQPQQQALAPADPETIRSIQTGLAKLGFDPGPADGVASAKTRAAIREFQQQSGLPANGEPSRELAQKVAEQLAARGN